MLMVLIAGGFIQSILPFTSLLPHWTTKIRTKLNENPVLQFFVLYAGVR
jgi:hypothetical protein